MGLVSYLTFSNLRSWCPGLPACPCWCPSLANPGSPCLPQDSDISAPSFADGEFIPTESGFFPEDEEEAMTLASPEGPQESDMDSPMESTQGLEGSIGHAEEKARELGGLFLPDDK